MVTGPVRVSEGPSRCSRARSGQAAANLRIGMPAPGSAARARDPIASAASATSQGCGRMNVPGWGGSCMSMAASSLVVVQVVDIDGVASLEAAGHASMSSERHRPASCTRDFERVQPERGRFMSSSAVRMGHQRDAGTEPAFSVDNTRPEMSAGLDMILARLVPPVPVPRTTDANKAHYSQFQADRRS